MSMDDAMLAEARQANEPYRASYPSRLAAEIVAMLPELPDEARQVPATVDVILNVKVPPRQPPASEPRPPDAA